MADRSRSPRSRTRSQADIGNVMFIFSNSLFNLPAVQFAGFAESQDTCDLVRDRGERLRSAMLIYKKYIDTYRIREVYVVIQHSYLRDFTWWLINILILACP
jgi:hypothetical protein